MGTLHIHLLGSIYLGYEQQPRQIKLTRSVTSLLAFLLLQRYRLHPREVLAGIFWGNQREEQARRCLNTAMWRLRRLLEPEGISKGTYLLTTPMGEIGFNRDSDHWLDVAVFEDKVTAVLAKKTGALSPEDVRELEYAVSLYKSDLLEGCYDDWAVRERERLRLLLMQSLIFLMRYKIQSEEYEDGLLYGQKILDLDPLREEIHRDLMRLYMQTGRRSTAMRQYDTCRRLLAQELDIPPMEDTQKLYLEILQGNDAGRGRTAPPQDVLPESGSSAAVLELVLENLHLAIKELERGHQHLQHSLKLLQRFLREAGKGTPV
ncbi:MAG: hypothetical protein FJ135_08625 [Deltaproteobacteria bacterium]|nr:hypothetical protein [Deltaproteobacteria bacterium]